MKNPAVSVIIPMFNAEDFVAECLTSLLNQTFQNFEVIVADDCSTDSSVAVVKKFSSNFGGRLKLMTLSKNSGRPGIPRNFALEAARGKYVYFLDSDDLLSENALEDFFNVAETFNADVVHSEKCIAFIGEGEQIQSKVMSNQTGEFVTEPTLETFDIGERVTAFTRKRFLWWACNKLFRRKFLVDNEIQFPVVSTFEDFVFAFECLVAAKNYVRVPFVNYHYRIRENSLSHKGCDAVKISTNMITIVRELDKFMDGKNFFRENPACRYELLDFFIRERLNLISKGFFVSSDLSPAEVFDFFREKIFFNQNENAALTSYLFVAANIYKLYSAQQATEIETLKRQLAEAKKQEVSN